MNDGGGREGEEEAGRGGGVHSLWDAARWERTRWWFTSAKMKANNIIGMGRQLMNRLGRNHSWHRTTTSTPWTGWSTACVCDCTRLRVSNTRTMLRTPNKQLSYHNQPIMCQSEIRTVMLSQSENITVMYGQLENNTVMRSQSENNIVVHSQSQITWPISPIYSHSTHCLQ